MSENDISTLSWSAPQIFDMNNAIHREKIDQLKKTGDIVKVIDSIDQAFEELFHIENPKLIDEDISERLKEFVEKKCANGTDNYGRWVYFRWSSQLVHFPEPDDLRKLRGSRNRNLITEEERQKLINDKCIVVSGLSVGSNVVDSLLMQGIGSKYVLVDMDNLSPTNLNRIRASYSDVGLHKVDILAKKISELDPYIEQVHYTKGLDESNLDEIISIHKPNLMVDEMDSLRMKIIIRLKARENRIPLLMATDNGDNIILDVERYDLKEHLPILHGILPKNIIEDILVNKPMSRSEAGSIIGRYFADLQNVPIRMIESLMQVGVTIPSWPQLGGAAVLSGLYVAYAARKIILGEDINDGRYLMGPDEQLDPSVSTKEYIHKKTELISRLTSKPTTD